MTDAQRGMSHKFGTGILLAAGLVLASCAPAGSADAGAAALTPKQAKTLDKQLAGKVAGKPQNCIQDGPSYQTIRVSDDILLYKVSNGLVYRNDLRNTCRGLARGHDTMVIKKFGSQTCEGDFFHLVDGSSGIRGGSCVFGEFVPYRRPKGDAS